MANGQSDGQKERPGKKELKKQLADRMETALPELREMLGEKKFMHRLKKAAKLLMEGLHKDEVTKKKKQPATKAATAEKAAAKKVTTKKSAAKDASGKVSKMTVDKSTTKHAKAAPAAKAQRKKAAAGKQ